MTNRIVNRGVWAEDATVVDITDPDLDTGHPLYNPAYYEQGWLTDRPPHQWQNFFNNRLDTFLKAVSVYGNEWNSAVAYKAGSLVVGYVAVAASTGQDPTTDDGTYWEATAFTEKSQEEMAVLLDDFIGEAARHAANRSNPHNDSADNVGTYSQDYINTHGYWTALILHIYGNIFITQEDGSLLLTPQGEVMLIEGQDEANPHGTTAIQTGAVPSTGGTFSGLVNQLRMNFLGGRSVDSTAEGVRIKGVDNLGLALDGKPMHGAFEVLHTGNFEGIKRGNSTAYTIPVPALHIPLVSGVDASVGMKDGLSYDLEGNTRYTASTTSAYTDKSGNSQTSAVDTPAINEEGLVIFDLPNQILLTNDSIHNPHGAIFAVVNGAPVVYNDVDLDPITTNILSFFAGLSPTSIRDIRIWENPLTQQQIAALNA